MVGLGYYKKVFFSQPMRGIEQSVIEDKFNRMQKQCNGLGYELLSSVKDIKSLTSLQEFKKFSFNLVTQADMLVYDNYDVGQSPTLHEEVELAIKCGIPCYSFNHFLMFSTYLLAGKEEKEVCDDGDMPIYKDISAKPTVEKVRGVIHRIEFKTVGFFGWKEDEFKLFAVYLTDCFMVGVGELVEKFKQLQADWNINNANVLLDDTIIYKTVLEWLRDSYPR